MTRDEHLAWAKKRAHEYVDCGDLPNAINSMVSDLGKHEAWKDSPFIGTMVMVAMMEPQTPYHIGRWIDGFN